MNPVRQEDGLGCAVACVAFVLQISYQEAVELFSDGKRRVREEANFYCPEIVQILNNTGLKYTWKKIPDNLIENEVKNYSIVFIKRSKNYPYGHFLCKYNDSWMDPWINLPDKNIKAGFRNTLPGKPTYAIIRAELLLRNERD